MQGDAILKRRGKLSKDKKAGYVKFSKKQIDFLSATIRGVRGCRGINKDTLLRLVVNLGINIKVMNKKFDMTQFAFDCMKDI